MGGRTGRPVAVAIAAMLAVATPGAALAEESCPPPPPYGVPAYVIEFVWDQPVAVEYGVATEVRPSNDAMPGVWPMLGGDSAVLTGGCDDPVEPLLITRRDQSRGSVDRAEQAASGIGTYSDCGIGGTWAGMAQSQEVPGEPWTYTIVVSGVRPCEGAYVDSVDENFIAMREQPESATVTAAVTYYPALQTVPAGEPVTLEADVGVVNVKSLDSAPLEGGPNAGYERPLPVVLGTVTLPPIGSSGGDAATGAEPGVAGGDVGSGVEPFDWRAGITGADRAATSVGQTGSTPSVAEDTPDGSRKPSPMLRLMAMLLLLEAQEKGEDAAADSAMTMLRFMREIGYLDDSSVASLAGPTTTAGADATEAGLDTTTKPVDPPSVIPPAMSEKARKQNRQWVWLPADAAVRRKGATHWLKPGVWYQTKVDKDGNRAFYDKKGKLIGTTGKKAPVKVLGEEAKPADKDQAAAAGLLTLLVDATTGSMNGQPATPPPAPQSMRGEHWVYVTLPTQTYDYRRDSYMKRVYDIKSDVLVPGRWYQGDYRASKRRWTIYSADGDYLGAKPDENLVVVSPTTPLPADESQ